MRQVPSLRVAQQLQPSLQGGSETPHQQGRGRAPKQAWLHGLDAPEHPQEPQQGWLELALRAAAGNSRYRAGQSPQSAGSRVPRRVPPGAQWGGVGGNEVTV